MNQTQSIKPLRDFVTSMTKLVDEIHDEPTLIKQSSLLLSVLISKDGWLPEFCSIPNQNFYQQYLLHADPLERFSIVSFVWGPGQKTPIHDHCTWGLIGMLRGAEKGQSYKYGADGMLVKDGAELTMLPGDIAVVSPTLGDIHVVSNALPNKTSISIHVYGANIGAVKRHTFEANTGVTKNFVSGYSSQQIPNLWDKSCEVRAEINK
jgi:predicted metal-dependent enzyme (double-stranded beta helix superfamily)